VTVKEMIEQLQKLPQDLEVKSWDPNHSVEWGVPCELVGDPEFQVTDHKDIWHEPFVLMSI
jgi:hypothetical protein